MRNWSFRTTAIITALIVTLPWVLGMMSSQWEIAACILSGLSCGMLGMAVGTVIFLGFRRLFGRIIRLVGGLVSLIVGGIAGGVFGIFAVSRIWNRLVFVHPGTYGGDIVYIFLGLFSMVSTAVASLVFGMGPGKAAESPRPSSKRG